MFLILIAGLVGQSPPTLDETKPRPRAVVVESGDGDGVGDRSIYPQIKLPAQVTGEAGRPIEISGTTNGKEIYWFCQDDTRALRKIESKTVLFTTPKPGRYRVWAWSVLGDRSTNANMVWVIVTPPTDDPDVPPNPPIPPSPPTPPEPSEIAKEIAAAYAADAGEKKSVTLGKLIAFYAAVADHVKDKNTKTVGVFLEVYTETAAKLLPDGELIGVRQAIGKRVFSLFPADTDTQIDDSTRAKAVSFFSQVVAALQAVKK